MWPESLQLRCLILYLLLCRSVTAVNIGKFWHVTDFHYDHTYWTTHLSCNANITTKPTFGDYWCDSPWRLITASISAMKNYDPDVDFLLWTGDTVAHISDDHLSVDINMDVLSNITDHLKMAFPNKKVYATYGNHDYYPSDQFPNLNNIIYNRTAIFWQDWIEETDQMTNFRKGGYYTRLIRSGLRVVALNTNLYYTSNKETPGIKDPSDQLQWLRTVLETAKTNGEKVIVTAHIPPGVHTPTRSVWFHPEFEEPVLSVLQDYAGIIVGMHFGHDHHDGFKVFPNKQGNEAAPFFVAPSVTPWRYKLRSGATGPPHNPSVRLVIFDRETGKHLNILQFMLDLPASNAQGSASFILLYNFTQHYKVPDISSDSLDKLVTRMDKGVDGDQLLDDYFKFTTGGADQGDRTCDKSCKQRFLCGFRHYTYTTFDQCIDKYTSSASGIYGTIITHAALFVVAVMLAL